ncbi:MAG: hypothetical protein JJW01_03380 [Alphaproteobacteria bacterium]|nr:hypothetical protein [Rickettsiales bacterium]
MSEKEFPNQVDNDDNKIDDRDISLQKRIGGSFSYKEVEDEMLPFACYIDPFTILLKNGEIMRTVMVRNYSNSSNLKGDFFLLIRKAINELTTLYGHGNISFWIHNIRTRNIDIITELMRNNYGENIFHSTLEDNWRDTCVKLNNYDTVCYVTIIIQCIDVKLSLKKMPFLLNKTALSSYINRTSSDKINLLNKITKDLIRSFSRYETRLLKCFKSDKNDVYTSDHLQFFSRLFNFDNKKYLMPMASLSSAINNSLFNFDFGTFSAQKDEKEFHGSIFTIKDTSCATPSILTSLMNEAYDIVTCEIFHGIDEKRAASFYKKQIETVKDVQKEEWEDKTIAEKMKLNSFIEGKNNLSFKHYAGFMIVSRTSHGLVQSVDKFMKRVSESGLHVGKEDIGLERAFYSFLPGNFRFVGHSSIVNQNEVGGFAYSYIFDNENIKLYRDKKPLLLIPTSQSNTYAFGILKDKSNILISSSNDRLKSIFTDMMAIYYLLRYNANWYSLSFTNHRDTLMQCVSGANYVIDTNEKRGNYVINLFGCSRDKAERVDHLSICLEGLIGDKVWDKMYTDTFLDIVNALADCNSLEDVYACFDTKIASTFFAEQLRPWFSVDGEFSRLFDIRQDVENEYSLLETIAFVVMMENLQHSHDKSFFISIILHSILQKILNYDFPCFVTINNPFVISKMEVPYRIMCDIMNSYANKETVCVLLSDQTDTDAFADGEAKFNVDELSKTCDTQFHLFDSGADELYAKMYQLEPHELIAIKKLKSIKNSAILKQTDLILPIKIDLSDINESIKDIIYDNATFRERVARCKSFFNTEDMETWVKYFVDRSDEEKRNNVPLDGEEFVKEDNSNIKRDSGETKDESIAKEILRSG